ncbi:segregation and condensation protein A [Planococcus glaciei CHR43]|uniref:segregation/condensation protein A n=1 Tax=Planococcus glaciei TaxID=459472 RepID=UPI0003DF1B1E|nr:segregation/condensation protein A [Planococcus glaciei]ETP69667.1 segregation and condensation protein A [Planococcus glaciei CHR43]ETP70723.1 segregation and condensation protein A [Planococcus glaciei CHR43]ETP70743.1 segregation and condensation protein A [Planococcus glaciei CHR43]
MSYEVKVEAFEGPLDLLLHLIHRLEIDIYDIPVSQITTQYMEHIRALQVLELNEASEYLVMAATLLAIKSKMLLPVHEGDLEDIEYEFDEQDPRDELVNRLVEYRKYKEASVKLKELESNRSAIFTKAPMDLSGLQPASADDNLDLEVNAYDMLGAFQKLLRRKQLKAPLSARVARQEVSIKDQMTSIVNRLKAAKGRTPFTELFPSNDKAVLVVSFLSVLELMKRQVIQVEQEKNFTDLMVELKKETWEYEDDSFE